MKSINPRGSGQVRDTRDRAPPSPATRTRRSPLKIISALALWHTEDGQAHFAFVDGVDQRSDKDPSPFDCNKSISTISHSFGSLSRSPLDSNCGLTFGNRSSLPRSLGHKILPISLVRSNLNSS